VTGWTNVFQGSRWEADMVFAILESHGFHPQTYGGMATYGGMDFNDSPVFVPEEEAEAARELLDRPPEPDDGPG
jgi:hypothetical protein